MAALRQHRHPDAGNRRTVNLYKHGASIRSREILFERRGAAGIVVLNQSQALNAVTLPMVEALTRQLSGGKTIPPSAG